MPGGMICYDGVFCVSSIDAHDFRAPSAHKLGFDPLRLGEQSSWSRPRLHWMWCQTWRASGLTSIEPSVSTRTSGSQRSSGIPYLPLLRPQIYRWDEAGRQSGAGAGVGVSAHHCHLQSTPALPAVCVSCGWGGGAVDTGEGVQACDGRHCGLDGQGAFCSGASTGGLGLRPWDRRRSSLGFHSQ